MAALYFRQPTEDERIEAGTDEPFTVLERVENDNKEAQQAFSDMFEESTDAFNKFISSWRK